MTTLGCAEIERVAGIRFQTVDAGGIAGGAVHVALGRERLVASAQYELGLAKVQEGLDAKNRAFTISFGIEVPIR